LAFKVIELLESLSLSRDFTISETISIK